VFTFNRAGLQNVPCTVHSSNGAHGATFSLYVKNYSPREYQFESIFSFSKSNHDSSDFYIDLPIKDSERVRLDGHKVLTERSADWNTKYKQPFKDAFRQLAAVYEPFASADIASAERILSAEAKRSGDAFEAVGLKIPAEIAVRCGVLLVLGIQLYLLIHLREFGNRLDRQAGFEVAWIGVYTSELARGMLFASLLLLPLATVCALDIRGFAITEERWRAWTIFVSSLYACLALSYLIFTALPKPPAPPLPAADQSPSAPEQSDASLEQGFE
jgi:hypothetical protein